jgi:hypothetical protein
MRALRRVVVLVTGAVLWCGIAPPARAAHLRVDAPDTCAEAGSIGEQVDGLLGSPLAAVEDVDFELVITKTPDRRWRLRLETIDAAGGNRRTRELAASSCRELADAAAVAIALTIKATQAEAPRPPSPPPVSEASPRAPGPPAPAAPAPREVPRSPPPARKALGLSALLDSGAMPRAAFGLGLEASLDLRRLRLAASGALFPAQQTRLASGSGGSFQLAVLAALACFAQEPARVTLMACAGGEAGRLTGEGVGVATPRSQGALWLAARGDVGASVRLAGNLALVVQAGAAIPRRPSFVLDGATTVHQPSSVTLRAAAGVELGF